MTHATYIKGAQYSRTAVPTGIFRRRTRAIVRTSWDGVGVGFVLFGLFSVRRGRMEVDTAVKGALEVNRVSMEWMTYHRGHVPDTLRSQGSIHSG